MKLLNEARNQRTLGQAVQCSAAMRSRARTQRTLGQAVLATNGRSAKPCNQRTLGQAVLPITDNNHQIVIPAIIPATIPDAGHPTAATSLTDSKLLGLEGLRQSTGTERRAFGREHAALETGASWSIGQS